MIFLSDAHSGIVVYTFKYYKRLKKYVGHIDYKREMSINKNEKKNSSYITNVVIINRCVRLKFRVIRVSFQRFMVSHSENYLQ